MPSTIVSSSAGTVPPCLLDPAADGVGGALAHAATVDVDAAHAVWAEKATSVAPVQVALAQTVALLGEHDDRAAFGRLVGEAQPRSRLDPPDVQTPTGSGRRAGDHAWR